jgi:hypothetical protein
VTVVAEPDSGGDAPDSFDDRLAVIVRLIDTMEHDNGDRRRARRALVLGLLVSLTRDATARIVVQLDRLDD